MVMVISPSEEPVRLLHLSDIHFGKVDLRAIDVVTAFVRQHRPDAVVVAGDLTQNGRRREFEAARNWLDQLGLPVLVAPGNHDTPAMHLPLQAPGRLFAPFRRYARMMGEHDVVGKLALLGEGRVRVSAINSARGVQGRLNWADGVIDLGDLEEALDLLADGPRDAWRVLVCHHPLHEPAHSHIAVDTRRGGEALRRCAMAHVDAILTGHIHDAFAHPLHGPRRCMVQMGSGTLSTRLRGSHASFCIVTLGHDHILQEIVTVCEGGGAMHLNYDSRINQPGMLLQHGTKG